MRLGQFALLACNFDSSILGDVWGHCDLNVKVKIKLCSKKKLLETSHVRYFILVKKLLGFPWLIHHV